MIRSCLYSTEMHDCRGIPAQRHRFKQPFSKEGAGGSGKGLGPIVEWEPCCQGLSEVATAVLQSQSSFLEMESCVKREENPAKPA